MNFEASYLGLSDEIKHKISTYQLSEKDIKDIEQLIKEDYEYYSKWALRTKISMWSFLGIFILFFVTMYRASHGASMNVLFIVMFLLALTTVTVIISSMKINKMIYIKEAIEHMKRYYPEEFKKFNLE